MHIYARRLLKATGIVVFPRSNFGHVPGIWFVGLSILLEGEKILKEEISVIIRTSTKLSWLSSMNEEFSLPTPIGSRGIGAMKNSKKYQTEKKKKYNSLIFKNKMKARNAAKRAAQQESAVPRVNFEQNGSAVNQEAVPPVNQGPPSLHHPTCVVTKPCTKWRE
ncbi:hypothetical protein MKW98_000970 [Papaver atlanticum]|uniref:Uncharacterized protein n=1 Tax=Papaver atlanticum TaxID=357466 RepID=A0AAD4SEC1_9MAGN|nr:hypothetical protein MKW98_000970 [Papaver atlanticum]